MAARGNMAMTILCSSFSRPETTLIGHIFQDNIHCSYKAIVELSNNNSRNILKEKYLEFFLHISAYLQNFPENLFLYSFLQSKDLLNWILRKEWLISSETKKANKIVG